MINDRTTDLVISRAAPVPEYTEGVCDDGVAIFCDGRMMPVNEILSTLNGYAAAIHKLHKNMDD